MEYEMLKYIRLVKVDEATHEVWGVATSEVPDKDREIADYEESKKAFRIWSDEFLAKTTAAGQEPSMGNIRLMHQLDIAGKAIKIEYRDATREIWLGTRPVDDRVWNLIQKGFVTGYSIGGSYAWKRSEGTYKRFAPIIAEVSYVDNGCNPDATFAYIKADGAVEMRKFQVPSTETVFTEPQLRKINELITSATGGPTGGRMTHEEVQALVKAEMEKTNKSLHDHLDNLKKAVMDNCAKAVGMCEKTAAMHKDGMEMACGHIDNLKKALGGAAPADTDDAAKKAREAEELAKAERERVEKAAQEKEEKDKLDKAAAELKAKEDKEKLDKAVAEAKTQAEKDALLKAAADARAKEEKEKLDKAAAEVITADRKVLTDSIAALVKGQADMAAKIEELTKARGDELEPTRVKGLTLVGRDGGAIAKAAEASGDLMRNTGI